MRTATCLFVALFACSPKALADTSSCDCARREPPCSAYWNASAVFVGRVDRVARASGTRTITFTILERYRGVSSSSLDVATGPAGQRCSLSLQTGHEYVVYAQKTDAGVWTTSVCAGTREVADAAADLTYARDLREGTAADGRIGGQIVRVARDLAGKTIGPRNPVADAVVVLSKDGATETTTTNHAGDFSFPSRGPGRYSVDVKAADEYYSDDPPSTVELRDARGCAEIERRVYDNGRVAGRVLDSSSRPIAGLTIELTSGTGPAVKRAVTNRDGAYELSRLPPGRYLIGINVGPHRRTATHRPLQFVYPGVEKLTSAKRVTLGPGASVALDDLRLPPHIKYVSFSGVVLDATGVPATRARVYLKGMGEDDEIAVEPATTDGWGRFVIAVQAAEKYRLFAESARDATDQVTVSGTVDTKAMRLTLRRRY